MINYFITVMHVYFLIAGFHKVVIFELCSLQQSKVCQMSSSKFWYVGFLIIIIHFLCV